jgi:hypothetical protein
MISRVWMNSIKAMALSLAAALSLAGSASAAVILVNDTWLDGTDADPASQSENGTDLDSDGNLESAWYQGGDGTLDPVGAGGPLQAKFSAPTVTGSASWTTYFTPAGGEVNLANPGEQLKVTWIFTPTNINNGGSNTSQNFRLAVVDTPDANRLLANGAPGSAAYNGYGMFMNMSGTLGNSNPFRLMERNAASGAMLSGSGDWAPLANGATTGNTGYVSGTEYTYTMTITRNALNGLDIVSRMAGGSLDNDGVAEVMFTDPTPNNGSFKFDTFSLRPSGATTTAETFSTRLFMVEAPKAIPEPTTLILLGMSSLALVGLRRRS